MALIVIVVIFSAIGGLFGAGLGLSLNDIVKAQKKQQGGKHKRKTKNRKLKST